MTWMGMGPPFPRRQGTRYAQSADQKWSAKSLDNHLADCRRGVCVVRDVTQSSENIFGAKRDYHQNFLPLWISNHSGVTFFNPQTYVAHIINSEIWKRNHVGSPPTDLLDGSTCCDRMGGNAALFGCLYHAGASRWGKHWPCVLKGAAWLEGVVWTSKWMSVSFPNWGWWSITDVDWDEWDVVQNSRVFFQQMDQSRVCRQIWFLDLLVCSISRQSDL